MDVTLSFEVHLPRTKQLVEKCRNYCKDNAVLQKTLANQLGLSPTAMNEIFQGRNNPSCEVGLHMLSILESELMKPLIDPPTFPKPSTRDPSIPLTLSAAREMLEAKNAEIAALRRAAASPAKSAFTVPAPTAKPRLAGSGADPSPTFPTVTNPSGNRPNTNEMAVNFKAPPLALLPADADCPARIQKYLDRMTEAEVRDCLRGEHDPLRLGMTYKELQRRKALTAIG